MPKWIPALEDALSIYDEVIMALPHHELGAKALYGKARLLFKDEDYKASIETYQALIRRFPDTISPSRVIWAWQKFIWPVSESVSIQIF
jgi:tetratricopeptide (TPR) repeat protein